MSLSIKDAIDLYQSQYALVDTLWGYFSAVTIAVLGYTVGAERSTQKLLEFRVMQCGFLVFAVGNLLALIHAQNDLLIIKDYANSLGKVLNPQILLNPVEIWQLMLFHFLVTASVILGLHYIHKARIEKDLNNLSV